MHLSLIGMSNIGKSHWSQRLAAEKGWARLDCDALIEAQLTPELHDGGYRGIHDMARWMGQPYEPGYAEASARYVASEQRVLSAIFNRLRRDPSPAVIDTPGSLVYAGADILDALRALTLVVYLEAPKNHAQAMFRRYLDHPKPVIWGGMFVPRDGETPQESLKRCFPALLDDRARRYKAVAHITIPYAAHQSPSADLTSLILQAAAPA